MSSLPPLVRSWRDAGRFVEIGDHKVFVVDRPGPPGPPIVIVHGFPGSSFDWHAVVPSLSTHRRVVAFDLLGYGLTTKPTGGYSLFAQADLVQDLLATLDVARCALIAHDMGDTVAAELAHRHNAGELPFDIAQLVLTNGSIFIDMAQLTRGQRLAAALPNRRLPLPLPAKLLRRSLLESFAAAAPPPEGALEAMLALIQHGGGARLLPMQIRYIEERRRHQSRWTQALVDYTGPLTAIWGELDPIAVVDMPHRLQGLRPNTDVLTWPDTGHWPSVEQPQRLASAIADRLVPSP